MAFASSRIENSTVSGNQGRYGGGIVSQESLTISNSTISNNTGKSRGGGIYVMNGEAIIERSIVSGNRSALGAEIYRHNHYSVIVTVDNHNLFGTNGNSGLYGLSPGATDIVASGGISNILAPPADNGGPTFTRALVTGSPAIDGSTAQQRTSAGC